MRILSNRHLPVISMILLCAFVLEPSCNGADVSGEALGRLIVLDNGRQKPLDTYARIKLLQFSGKQKLHDKHAIDWLAGLLFNPQSTFDDKVILINNPEIPCAIGVEPDKIRRYSFNSLSKGYQTLTALANKAYGMDQKDRTPFDNEILRVNGNIVEFMNIAAVLDFTEPLPEFAIVDSQCARFLGFDTFPIMSTYLDLFPRDSLVSAAMNAVSAKDRSQWSAFDTAIIKVSHALYQWSMLNDNSPLWLIPSEKSNTLQWLSPKGYIIENGPPVCTSSVIRSLVDAKKAFQRNDIQAFNDAIGRFLLTIRSKSSGSMALKDPTVELIYNHVNPFNRAKILYGIAFVLSLLVLLYPEKWLGAISLIVLAAGFVLHTYGIIARMLILARPPVTNLFEIFLFVAWAGVILGIAVELINRKGIGFILASICGFAFLHYSGRFGFEGDTMGMLAAALNNNFWLASHITTIASGYAGCICAGIVGHIFLIQKTIAPFDIDRHRATSRALSGLLAFGMTFTVIGTVLGGLWADQAWGRFWGWDPKENGALLIILWCAILFCARAGKMISDFGMAIGSVVCMVLIMLTWIGINLLGVGLHSYGFTSGGAVMLIVFIAIEAVFIALTSFVVILRKMQGV